MEKLLELLTFLLKLVWSYLIATILVLVLLYAGFPISYPQAKWIILGVAGMVFLFGFKPLKKHNERKVQKFFLAQLVYTTKKDKLGIVDREKNLQETEQGALLDLDFDLDSHRVVVMNGLGKEIGELNHDDSMLVSEYLKTRKYKIKGILVKKEGTEASIRCRIKQVR